MLFNSYEFIFFFMPATLVFFYVLSKLRFFRTATFSLVLASLVFYSYWDVRSLPLLIFSIVFNYLLGKAIERTLSRGLLILGAVVDLGLLGYFKYTCFLLQSCNLAFDTSFFVPSIVMPIGISFFTFTQLAYLVDAYRGETKGYDFLSYSLFVTIFPHLIAGPILYHKDVIPQFHNADHYEYSSRNMASGLTIFILGLCKKVIIADHLSQYARLLFDNANASAFFDAWAGALAYTFQLYFDFSGYSDMAIGLGLMFNVHLPINFNSPYKAASIIDFWRRWHITLSSFLKNYLYIPLGGSRRGEVRKALNIMITMLLGGLWHGAGWTFVIWGGLHGVYLVVNHLWRKVGVELPDSFSRGLTFFAVVFGWVFFRANTLSDGVEIVKAMLGLKGVMLPAGLAPYLGGLEGLGVTYGKLPKAADWEVLGILMALLIFTLRFRNSQQCLDWLRPKWWLAAGVGMLGALSILRLNQATEFLYFQF